MESGNDRPSVGLEDLFLRVRMLGGALDLLPLPSLVLAGDGSAMAVNGGWTRLSGVSAAASRGEGWLGALEPLDRGPLRRRLAGAAAASEPGSGDFRLAGPGGDQWCRWWWQPGAPGQLVVCVADLDQPVPRDSVPLPRAVDGSQWRLVRRSEFVNRIARALRRSRWTGAVVAVVVVAADLNELGSATEADDPALMAARRVLATGWPVAVGALVSRDEFAVLCDDLRDPGEVASVAARIRASALSAAGAPASPRLRLRTGVAVALADDTAETLIARACDAMSSADPADRAPDCPAFPAAPAAAVLDVAADLVNRLFSVGLSLASATSLVNGAAGARLEEAIDDLDAIINDVRSAIFATTLGSGSGGDAE